MWEEETLFSVLRNYLRITRNYLCTFVLFAKFMFHSKTHIQRKMLGQIQSTFKVSPPNSKSKYPKGPKPRQRFKTKSPFHQFKLVFFFLRKFNFHWFTSNVIPPSPFPLPIHTVCVSVTQSHPNLFEWTVRMDQTMGHFCVGRIKMFPQIKQTIFTIHPVAK